MKPGAREVHIRLACLEVQGSHNSIKTGTSNSAIVVVGGLRRLIVIIVGFSCAIIMGLQLP